MTIETHRHSPKLPISHNIPVQVLVTTCTNNYKTVTILVKTNSQQIIFVKAQQEPYQKAISSFSQQNIAQCMKSQNLSTQKKKKKNEISIFILYKAYP